VTETLPPAPSPCGSCPYRRDVPSGIWAPEEYAKLPPYDEPTPGQPGRVFLCHQIDGRACAGWAGCHDTGNLLSLRLAVAMGAMSRETVDAVLDYVSPVPLWESGTEAAAHGLAEVTAPGSAAHSAMRKISKRRGHLAG
jgi:hypothetical protein